MDRALAPEWLDALPADDRQAVQSRRDLRWVNAFMRNARHVTGALQRCFPEQAPRRIVEAGAGDGAFLLRAASLLASRWKRVHVVLVDKSPAAGEATRRGFKALGWTVETVTADVFDWLEQAPATDAIVANLFLHHFESEALRRLLQLSSERTAAVVACEPRRSVLPLALSRLVFALGCNAVTRHDAPISVRAGFYGREISHHWPTDGWRLEERRVGMCSHLFVAQRPA